jgi:hypothetical protein
MVYTARRSAIFQAWQRCGRVSLTYPCFSDRRLHLTKRAIRLDTIWQREVRVFAAARARLASEVR